jgi:predicted phage terminase large subunit-like protein
MRWLVACSLTMRDMQPDATRSALVRAARAAIASARPITQQQQAARQCTLANFVRWAWAIIEPATPLIWNWHLDAICEHLQALIDGTLATNNLVISVPPGSGKSRMVSVMLPAWLWIKQPGWKGIFASGNPRVSSRDSMLTRALIGSGAYKNNFGIAWDLSDSQDAKTLFVNSIGGFRQATTSGSRVTGDRADFLGIDDPLDAQAAFSKAERDAVVIWYSQAFANRLNDLRTGRRVIIAQRLHEEDLIGYVLANEHSQWEHLMIPMEFEAKRRFTTSIGWTDPRTTDGDLLFAERYPAEIVQQERARLGRSGYAGQMQQRPAALEGELFKRGCLQLLPADTLPACTNTIIALDTAFSEKQTADYSVAIVLGQHERGVLILDIVRGRYAYPQLKQIAMEMAARWKPSAVVVENKASGQSLIQSLQQESSLPVKAVNPDGDKVARANVITPSWEAHRIFAPIGAPWLDDFEMELYTFPKAPHDDQVDAFVHGVRFLTNACGPSAFLSWIAAQHTADKAKAVLANETPEQKAARLAAETAKPAVKKAMFDLAKTKGAVVTPLSGGGS